MTQENKQINKVEQEEKKQEEKKQEEKKQETKKKLDNLEIKNRPIFSGTMRRNEMMKLIIQFARENCPMDYEKFVNKLCFTTGLTTRKIKEDYISILISVDVLKMEKFVVMLGIMESEV